MKKYQGEDITFSLKFNNPNNPTVQNFDDVSNVIIYAYTSDDYIQKFSMVLKEGYSSLERVSATELSGVVISAYTSNMCGQLILEVMMELESESGDTSENLISKKLSKIFISESIIKDSI